MTHYLLRPWRLATLGLGIGVLYVGMHIDPAPDWIPATIWSMALATYVCAPTAIGILERREWRRLPLALFLTWLSVDGVYTIVLYVVDRHALMAMRDANWPASLCLFLICGMVWRRQRGEAVSS